MNRRTKLALARDKSLKAKHSGKRISADGNVYYEYRENHSDVNRTKKLAKGGSVKETVFLEEPLFIQKDSSGFLQFDFDYGRNTGWSFDTDDIGVAAAIMVGSKYKKNEELRNIKISLKQLKNSDEEMIVYWLSGGNKAWRFNQADYKHSFDKTYADLWEKDAKKIKKEILKLKNIGEVMDFYYKEYLKYPHFYSDALENGYVIDEEDDDDYAKGGGVGKDAKLLNEKERFELKVLQGLRGFNNGLNINGLLESIGLSNYRFSKYASESEVNKVNKSLNSLIKKGYVDESGLGYNITQEGANYLRSFNYGTYAKGGGVGEAHSIIKKIYEHNTSEVSKGRGGYFPNIYQWNNEWKNYLNIYSDDGQLKYSIEQTSKYGDVGTFYSTYDEDFNYLGQSYGMRNNKVKENKIVNKIRLKKSDFDGTKGFKMERGSNNIPVSFGDSFLDKFSKGGEISEDRINEVLDHYMIAALWSSTDMDTDEPLDANYSISDIAPATRERMYKDVKMFIEDNYDAIEASGSSDEQLGHDLWLTRNGHGAGFFDRGYDKDVEEKLENAAREMKSVDLEVGDDGMIHQLGVFKKGGKITLKNNYIGHSAEDIWDNWSESQRSHFLLDHSELLDDDRLENNLGYSRIVQKDKNYSDLTDHTKRVLEAHVNSGQYKKGGGVKSNKWIQGALSGGKNKGALRRTAMRKGLLRNEDENLSMTDLHKLEKMGGKTSKRAHLAETLRKFADGGELTEKEQDLKSKIEAILDKVVPNFYHKVWAYKDYFGDGKNLGIVIAASDYTINNVRGQLPQAVSLTLSVNSLELHPQIFGGNGGQSIYRNPNLDDPKEKYLAMKSVKIPFRTPPKEEASVLKAIEKFAENYKKTLKENIDVLRYTDIVDYDALLSSKKMADGGGVGNENKYKEVNGTSYYTNTPQEVVDVLERARQNGTRIKLYYGDKETGRDWHETMDTTGTIGRSTGSIKVPLLISTSRSRGGGAILTDSIVKIKDTKTGSVLYQHKNYVTPKVEITPSDLSEYTHNVVVDGEIYGRHKSLKSAEILKSKLMADGGSVGNERYIFGIEYKATPTSRVFKKSSLTMSGKDTKEMNDAISNNAELLKKQEGWFEVRTTKTPILKDGGKLDLSKHLHSGRYISLDITPNGNLKITLDEDGRAEVLEMRDDDRNDGYIMDELFDDVRGNSELMYFDDAGEAGLGLTNAPAVTDGFYYDDNGDLTNEGHEDSELYYFERYMIDSFIDTMLEDGYVIFDRVSKSKKMAKGGRIAKNEDVLESFLESNEEVNVKNLSTHYNQHDKEVLLRNYFTLIATRKGMDVKITSKKFSPTTSTIQNKLKSLASKKGFNIIEVEEFEEGGTIGGSELKALERSLRSSLSSGKEISEADLETYLGRDLKSEEEVVGYNVRRCFLKPYYKKIK